MKINGKGSGGGVVIRGVRADGELLQGATWATGLEGWRKWAGFGLRRVCSGLRLAKFSAVRPTENWSKEAQRGAAEATGTGRGGLGRWRMARRGTRGSQKRFSGH